MAPKEPFLSRWSRKKATSGAAAPEETAAVERTVEPDPPAPARHAPAETVAQDMPDVTELDKDSDYTVFMGDDVPEEVQRLALRALWRSDPVLANLDGLNDYDEDFAGALDAGAEFMRKLARAESGQAENDEALETGDEPESEALETGDEPESEEPRSEGNDGLESEENDTCQEMRIASNDSEVTDK